MRKANSCSGFPAVGRVEDPVGTRRQIGIQTVGGINDDRRDCVGGPEGQSLSLGVYVVPPLLDL